MANETKINTQIWGAESEWIDVNNPPTLPYNLSTYIAQSSITGLQRMQAKIPYLKKATGAISPLNEYWRMQWRGLFLAADAVDEDNIIEKLSEPMPPEDFPIVWGLGKNSPGANSYYIYPEYIAGSNMFTEPAGGVSYCYKGLNTLYSPSNLDGENAWKDAKPIPFCFTSQQNTSPAYGVKFQQRNYQMGVGQSYISSVNNLSGNPILSFNYQNVVIYPLLAIAKENENSNYGYDFQFNVTIGAYFDGVNYDPDAGTGTPPLQLTYPYICCVYVGDIRIGANDGTTRSSHNGGSIFGGVAPGLFDLDEIQATEMLYKNQVKLWTTQLLSKYQGRNQFQTIQQSVLMGGIISGALNGTTPYYSFTMQTNTQLDTPQKAWIALTADSTSPTLPVFFQNGHYEPVLRQRRNLSNPNASYTQYLDFIPLWHDATKEDVLKDVAYLGFWFSEDSTTAGTGATGETCNSPLMHIPLFDEYGITTGEYKSGVAASLEENAKWQDPFKDNPYKPGDGDEDDDDEGDSGDITNSIPKRYANAAGLSYWVCSEPDLVNLHRYLNGTYLPTLDENTADFKGSNPQEYIVSCQKYPFTLPHVSTASHILIGQVDTSINAYPLTPTWGGVGVVPINSISTFSFGSIYVPKHFNDFRDYLSRLVIQLPFIGSFDLDAKIYIGNTISLDYIVDYNTGAVAALIYRNELITEVHTGTISISAPFFASNMGAYQNTLASLQFGIEQSKIKQISGIASTAISMGGALAGAASGVSEIGAAGIAGGLISGASSMASGLLQQQQLQYQIDHTVPSTASISTAAPGNAFLMDDRARLLIYRPRMLSYNPDSYAKSVGYACAQSGKLGSFAGYTVAAAIDLDGVPATAPEKAKIKQLLQAGIYI